jgi:hypothetical protein
MAMSNRPADLVSIADGYGLYPDEWVLMEITHEHNDYRKTWGRVIAHSANRDDLDEPYRRLREESPAAQTFEFYAGDVVPEGVVVVL